MDHAFARAWDEGVMLASRRTWWRVAARIADQRARPAAPTRRGSARAPRQAPVLRAQAPGDVWSWDITDLRSPMRGVSFKAYVAMDVFSRKVVAWRVEHRESDHMAVEMFARAFGEHGTPGALHADSGPAMRSGALGDLLESLGVARSHNRPRTSNDNPFSESEFRTMKYRPGYPGAFATIEDAREYIGRYVAWYNGRHKHSALALFSPDEVHGGTWQALWADRDRVHQDYYRQHPERFRKPPTTPAPAPLVGINLHLAQQQNNAA